VIGVAAVTVAAVAATPASTVNTSSENTEPTASHSRTLTGGYVVNTASLALASRDATNVSRSATRPPLLTRNKEHPDRAERRALARYALLREAADNAEKYARLLSSRRWALPTTGFHLTALFGVPGPYWASGYHTGIDFAAAYGTPVRAVGNGTVIRTGYDGAYGNQVRLKLPNGDQVWYNHLSAIGVTAGTPVMRGQDLGRVGDTGNAFGYHLHLEYRLASDPKTAVDPRPYLRRHGVPLS
jgi:murein DD-endopeptidase MepM/ murein hydrolase activator NlpD